MGLTQVSTDGVKDGSLLNADINASAAIAGSKIADFVTGNTNNRVLTASGTANSLIGEANLTFSGSSLIQSGNHVLKNQITDSSGLKISQEASNVSQIFNHYAGPMTFGVNNAEKMRIDSSGKVGIGTTSPTSAGGYAKFLQISDSNSASVAISRSASGTAHTLELGAFSGASLIESTGATSLRFKTNSSERMRIDSSGRVYMANSGLSATDVADDLVVGNLTGGHGITIQSQNNEGGFLCFGDTDTTGTGSRAGVIRYQHSDNSMRFATDGNNERMRILSGGGITFNGDTAAANALDDYEEGTFTPVPNAGGGVTFSIPHQVGFYTKIGNTVTFQLYLMFHASTITSGNAGNGLAIQGLPFTIKNNGRYNPSFTIGRTYNFDIDSDKRIYAYGDHNSTNIRMIVESDDTVGALLTAGQVDQSTCLTKISGTYQI